MSAKKTVQAIKIGATWTPSEAGAVALARSAFGVASPLHIRGGRLTINAAISIGKGTPGEVIRAYARAEELHKELAAVGTIHTFHTQAGAAPAEIVEALPAQSQEGTA